MVRQPEAREHVPGGGRAPRGRRLDQAEPAHVEVARAEASCALHGPEPVALQLVGLIEHGRGLAGVSGASKVELHQAICGPARSTAQAARWHNVCDTGCNTEDACHAQDHVDHQQQELFVLVPAWLVADALCRAGLRGSDGARRRPECARRDAAAGTVDAGALPAASGREGLGHAGHRRVPARDQAEGRAAARRAGGARALPRHLRRDALRLCLAALGAADEPERALSRLQGMEPRADRHRAGVRDLARMPGRVRRARTCSANAAWPTRCMPRW